MIMMIIVFGICSLSKMIMMMIEGIWYLHFPPQGPGLSQQIRRQLKGRKVGTFASLKTFNPPSPTMKHSWTFASFSPPLKTEKWKTHWTLSCLHAREGPWQMNTQEWNICDLSSCILNYIYVGLIFYKILEITESLLWRFFLLLIESMQHPQPKTIYIHLVPLPPNLWNWTWYSFLHHLVKQR